MAKTTKSITTSSSARTIKRICRIHVSQPAIRQNCKHGTDEPVITVKAGKDNVYGHEVEIYDDKNRLIARVMQPFGKTLSCGARVWVETKARVVVRKRKPFTKDYKVNGSVNIND